MRRAGLAGAVLLLLGAYSTSTDAGPAAPVDPAALYSQMCARCHGVEGHGDPELKKQMPTIRDFSDPEFRGRARNEDIEQVIMAGRNQMPAYGGMLSLPKIQTLTGYVKRLGAR
jgi:mono/diheme cytochrome c family protein